MNGVKNKPEWKKVTKKKNNPQEKKWESWFAARKFLSVTITAIVVIAFARYDIWIALVIAYAFGLVISDWVSDMIFRAASTRDEMKAEVETI